MKKGSSNRTKAHLKPRKSISSPEEPTLAIPGDESSFNQYNPFTGVSVYTWHTHPEGGTGLRPVANWLFYGSENVGHAALSVRLPFNEYGHNLIKNYCNGPPEIPYAVRTKTIKTDTGEQHTHQYYEVYFSWWPDLKEDPLEAFEFIHVNKEGDRLKKDINAEGLAERLNTNRSWDPLWEETLHPEKRQYKGMLGKTDTTHGMVSVVHQRENKDYETILENALKNNLQNIQKLKEIEALKNYLVLLKKSLEINPKEKIIVMKEKVSQFAKYNINITETISEEFLEKSLREIDTELSGCTQLNDEIHNNVQNKVPLPVLIARYDYNQLTLQTLKVLEKKMIIYIKNFKEKKPANLSKNTLHMINHFFPGVNIKDVIGHIEIKKKELIIENNFLKTQCDPDQIMRRKTELSILLNEINIKGILDPEMKAKISMKFRSNWESLSLEELKNEISKEIEHYTSIEEYYTKGDPPDNVVDLTMRSATSPNGLDPERMLKQMRKFIEDKREFNIVSKNCSKTVGGILKAGATESLAPIFDREVLGFIGTPQMVFENSVAYQHAWQKQENARRGLSASAATTEPKKPIDKTTIEPNFDPASALKYLNEQLDENNLDIVVTQEYIKCQTYFNQFESSKPKLSQISGIYTEQENYKKQIDAFKSKHQLTIAELDKLVNNYKDFLKINNKAIEKAKSAEGYLGSQDKTATQNIKFTDYKTAVYNRGTSFIEAAKIICDNANISKPDYFVALEDAWRKEKEKPSFNQDNLAALVRVLIDFVNRNVYHDKKDWKKVNEELENAENHVNWKKRDPVSSTAASDNETVKRTETPLSKFTTTQTVEWLKITRPPNEQPKWFIALPKWEQKLLQKKVNEWKNKNDKSVNLGEFLGTVPSTIRRYPGAPNVYRTEATVNGEKGEFTFTKIRSGVLAPFKMKAKSKSQKEQFVEITKQNLEQLVVEAINNKLKSLPNGQGKPLSLPILLQTLFSPPFQPPGGYTNEGMQKAVEQLRSILQDPDKLKSFIRRNNIDTKGYTLDIQLLYANRPVNKGRSLTEQYTKFSSTSLGNENRNTDNAISKHINLELKQYANKEMSKDLDLAFAAHVRYKEMNNEIGALNALKMLFKNPPYNPVAERAALEQIVMDKMGGVRIGSCVSGKDREEMITELALAQLQFYSKYGTMPPPFNPKDPENLKRIEFEDMVAKLYLNNHGQKLAGENAKGCDGLKNVQDVFGTRICERIKECAHDYGINLDKFDPIKTVQKVAGLNKLSPSKLGKITMLGVFKNFLAAIKKAYQISRKMSDIKQKVPPITTAYAKSKRNPQTGPTSDKKEVHDKTRPKSGYI